MPETTVVSPAAVVPADRLTLGSCDARVDSASAYVFGGTISGVLCQGVACMAEE